MQYESLRIGNTIRCLREQKKMSLEEMSYQLNRSVSHVGQIELGKRRLGMDMLYSLMDIFEVDANAILLIAEPKESCRFSIDAELAKLSEKDSQYLASVFLYMINQIHSGEEREVKS